LTKGKVAALGDDLQRVGGVEARLIAVLGVGFTMKMN
jgi:hypothetical protein